LDFLKFLTDLSRAGLDFVIVGGVAARLHGSHRLTHDLDLVPNLEPEAWERLIDHLWSLDLQPRIPETKDRIKSIDAVESWIAEKNLLAITFRDSYGQMEVDLLVSEAPSFMRLKQNATRFEYQGHMIFVANLDDLIDMKQRAGRPQDLLDVESLNHIKAKLSKSE
jgi:hypothetical protein